MKPKRRRTREKEGAASHAHHVGVPPSGSPSMRSPRRTAVSRRAVSRASSSYARTPVATRPGAASARAAPAAVSTIVRVEELRGIGYPSQAASTLR